MRHSHTGADRARQLRRLEPVHVSRHAPLRFVAVDGHQRHVRFEWRERGNQAVVQQRVAAVVNRLSVEPRHVAEEAVTALFVALDRVVRRRNAVKRHTGHVHLFSCVKLNEELGGCFSQPL